MTTTDANQIKTAFQQQLEERTAGINIKAREMAAHISAVREQLEAAYRRADEIAQNNIESAWASVVAHEQGAKEFQQHSAYMETIARELLNKAFEYALERDQIVEAIKRADTFHERVGDAITELQNDYYDYGAARVHEYMLKDIAGEISLQTGADYDDALTLLYYYGEGTEYSPIVSEPRPAGEFARMKAVVEALYAHLDDMELNAEEGEEDIA